MDYIAQKRHRIDDTCMFQWIHVFLKGISCLNVLNILVVYLLLIYMCSQTFYATHKLQFHNMMTGTKDGTW